MYCITIIITGAYRRHYSQVSHLWFVQVCERVSLRLTTVFLALIAHV
jgi:hypothetical protein